MCVCVCGVCVCDSERERERESVINDIQIVKQNVYLLIAKTEASILF